jgi:hypothetical protein
MHVFKCMGVNPGAMGGGGGGGGGGTRPPQFLEWWGRMSNYPSHFLTCLMKFCFLVILKPNAWYAVHQKL